MSLLTARNLAKEFGPDEIFSGVNVEIPHGARIALVGPNGAGKTTLLNLLVGLDHPSEGTIAKARGVRVGYLPQRPELLGAHTIREEMMRAFTDLLALERELNALEHRIAEERDQAQHTALLNQYGEMQEEFADRGGYTYEQRIKTVLHGLGFSLDDSDRKLSQLSGGQQTRVLLGRLLLEQPDLLALDEPTNHLDIEAVEWLEGFLKDFRGALLVVSHDRYFMDAIATTVWELDFGSLEVYRGNYSHYTQQRHERHERLLKEYEAQQEFIAKEQDYIRRNIAGQNTRQAQGRRTRLARLLKESAIRRPRQRDPMSLRMASIARSGDKVLMTRGLQVGYAGADAPLFHAPDITLRRGEVAALIGANGAGKSTFVKTIIEQLPPLGGEIVLGAQVQVGYFAQAHELLNGSNTLIDEITAVKPMPISEARNYLARFLFTGDDVFRAIDTLSGGERGRVALAKLALTGANLLLLDEPTNHLDIASQEILQNVLADFPGTILLVSHDRYLIDALATQIWALSSGELEVFEGTYKEFLAARDARKAAEAARREQAQAKSTHANGRNATANAGSKKHGLNPFELKKRIIELEARIPQLETRLSEITQALEIASAEGSPDRVRALAEAYNQAESDLYAAMEEWDRLVD